MKNESVSSDPYSEEGKTEVQATIETIVGYFKVMGPIFLAVVFLILVFIPAISKIWGQVEAD